MSDRTPSSPRGSSGVPCPSIVRACAACKDVSIWLSTVLQTASLTFGSVVTAIARASVLALLLSFAIPSPRQSQQCPKPCKSSTYSEQVGSSRLLFTSSFHAAGSRAIPSPAATAAIGAVMASFLDILRLCCPSTLAQSQQREDAIKETLETAVEAYEEEKSQTKEHANHDSCYGSARKTGRMGRRYWY